MTRGFPVHFLSDQKTNQKSRRAKKRKPLGFSDASGKRKKLGKPQTGFSFKQPPASLQPKQRLTFLRPEAFVNLNKET
jgi:hypothetical protein